MKTVRLAARFLLAALSFALALVVTASPAQAQATRTWVSGVGDDANPCSRTAPCKTFAGAISKTAAGGEINCLDPGGYGAVTVTKSITLDCEDTQGSILASSTTGVIVNGASVKVILRGLSISGSPPTSPGLNGVRFLQGTSLTMEKMIIQNFNGAAPNGFGVIVNPTAGALTLVMRDTTLANNGAATTGGGVGIFPTGTGTTVSATFDNVTATGSGGTGIQIDTTNIAGGGVRAAIAHSDLSRNQTGLLVVRGGAGPAGFVSVTDTLFNANTTAVSVTGSSEVRLSANVISHNTTGTSPGTGFISTYGDNVFFANTSDGTFNPAGAVAKR